MRRLVAVDAYRGRRGPGCPGLPSRAPVLAMGLAMAACDPGSPPTPETGGLEPALWPPALSSHVMVYHDSLERVLVYGGSRPDRSMSDSLWSWDGDRWRVETVGGPPARIHAGLAYDRYRNRLVIFGGIAADGTTLGDLWEWDGDTWVQPPPVSSGPGQRDHHAMVYSPAVGGIVLFGGQDAADTYPNDTWVWDGSEWERLPGPSPPPRATHRLVVGEPHPWSSGSIWLWGGWGPDRQFSDQWRLIERRWTPWDHPDTATVQPSPRGAHRLAYDEARQELVLFGGFAESELMGDTWTWTRLPIAWQRRDVAGPMARNVHGMTYDRRRERVVLFGGIGPDGRLDDLWEWDGATWEARRAP